MEITEDLIKSKSATYDIEIVRRVDLSDLGIINMTGIESCVNLVELVLEHNRIERIQAIHLAHLKFLNLAFNRISVIENLDCLPSLETLHLEGNSIESTTSLNGLSKCTKLSQLFLRSQEGNPVCEHPAYSITIRRLCPSLRALDSERVELKESVESVLLKVAGPMEIVLPEPKPWVLELDEDDFNAEDSISAATTSFSDTIKECLVLVDDADRLFATYK